GSEANRTLLADLPLQPITIAAHAEDVVIGRRTAGDQLPILRGHRWLLESRFCGQETSSDTIPGDQATLYHALRQRVIRIPKSVLLASIFFARRQDSRRNHGRYGRPSAAQP